MLTSGRRLEFEGEALAQIYSPTISRPRTRPRTRTFGAFLLVILVTGGAVLAAGALFKAGFFGSERRAITKTAESLLAGIANQDDQTALSVCAESEEGAGKLLGVEQVTFRQPTSPGSLYQEQEMRRESFQSIRDDLGAAGVNWKDVRLLAFGGIRGRVEEPQRMRKPVTVLAGTIYFLSGDKVFALELSAWRCNGDYVVTELWQGAPVTVGPDDLEAMSNAEFAAFQNEPANDIGNASIEYPKHLFFYF